MKGKHSYLNKHLIQGGKNYPNPLVLFLNTSLALIIQARKRLARNWNKWQPNEDAATPFLVIRIKSEDAATAAEDAATAAEDAATAAEDAASAAENAATVA